MPHYAMCSDRGCDHRIRCRRYRARPNANQSWFEPSPREPGWTQCEYLEVVRPQDEQHMREMAEIEGEVVERGGLLDIMEAH